MIKDLNIGDILILKKDLLILGYLPYCLTNYVKGQKFKVIVVPFNLRFIKIKSLDTSQEIILTKISDFITMKDILRIKRTTKLRKLGIK